jgi:hypothetical protein
MAWHKTKAKLSASDIELGKIMTIALIIIKKECYSLA